MSRVPADVVQAVYDREDGACGCCGERLGYDTELHHRLARGMGGSKGRDLDTVANIVVLKSEHHRWAHQHPAWARSRGLIVPSWANPACVPVVVAPFPY